MQIWKKTCQETPNTMSFPIVSSSFSNIRSRSFSLAPGQYPDAYPPLAVFEILCSLPSLPDLSVEFLPVQEVSSLQGELVLFPDPIELDTHEVDLSRLIL